MHGGGASRVPHPPTALTVGTIHKRPCIQIPVVLGLQAVLRYSTYHAPPCTPCTRLPTQNPTPERPCHRARCARTRRGHLRGSLLPTVAAPVPCVGVPSQEGSPLPTVGAVRWVRQETPSRGALGRGLL